MVVNPRTYITVFSNTHATNVVLLCYSVNCFQLFLCFLAKIEPFWVGVHFFVRFNFKFDCHISCCLGFECGFHCWNPHSLLPSIPVLPPYCMKCFGLGDTILFSFCFSVVIQIFASCKNHPNPFFSSHKRTITMTVFFVFSISMLILVEIISQVKQWHKKTAYKKYESIAWLENKSDYLRFSFP